MGDGQQTLTLALVLGEIADERDRQNAKWGPQNHASADERSFRQVPTATEARALCEAAARGRVTWLHILTEELAEAAEAAIASQEANTRDLRAGYRAELRAELIQVAAVAVAWIECLDRNGERTPVMTRQAATHKARSATAIRFDVDLRRRIRTALNAYRRQLEREAVA